ncbi:MAG: mannonate dehydratase [Paracoccus sp. (in: a-proteobacteria)]|mgnify:FL=1|uniref:mannonate dehydratase n=1 Tax=Paracoccus sp. TaxID=267 RepID=UPI000C6006EE|nr:mannonate dehydratase [Paracoccus sp. (in: a-proteobacteria)]MBA49653.1 mannonate dehydratase [Paracoccus sp. (in: a-proteobacteria)]|tara:strand:+ start:681 stop:1898 length:1218 start_codon:yes stop_codon:yes gene_type:complete
MRQTWRWFGPQDRVSIDDMLQAGVRGVVSALHHIPTGETWLPDEIARRQAQIAAMRDGTPSGLAWEVVESLPVSEAIKTQSGDWRAHVTNWIASMRHLRDAGIEVLCYNFMPVLDWTRTDLSWPRPSGARCMRFDFTDFAVFDIHILQRQGAARDVPEHVRDEAARRFADMDEARRQQLAGNVVFGLPGAAERFSLQDVRDLLDSYAPVTDAVLRRNFHDFLEQVAPVAQEIGMRLCCHPDDPPFALLGLPRIMSTEADYAERMAAVDLPANGITLCSGSLGARPDNDLPGMMDRLGDRVHFLHLRNVRRDGDAIRGSFFEDEHLAGQTDMVALIAAVLREERRRRRAGRSDAVIPMRPDHGQDILDDLGRDGQPGYPAIGRLKGLAELRGVEAALSHPLTEVPA